MRGVYRNGELIRRAKGRRKWRNQVSGSGLKQLRAFSVARRENSRRLQGRIKRPVRIAPSIQCRQSCLLKIPPKRRSGPFVHVIPVLQEELFDCSPVVCDVGLAIQLGVCEFAPRSIRLQSFQFSFVLSLPHER